MHRRLLVAMTVIVLVFTACSSDPDTDSAAPPDDGAAATSAPATTTSTTVDLKSLEGNWRFVAQDAKLNFGTGRMEGASVALEGNRVLVTSNVNKDTTSSFEIAEVGEFEMTCSQEICGISPFTGFAVVDEVVKVIDQSTLEPNVTAGEGTCGAPKVAEAGIVRRTSSNSFSYVDGRASEAGFAGSGSCYQVIWTIVATKL